MKIKEEQSMQPKQTRDMPQRYTLCHANYKVLDFEIIENDNIEVLKIYDEKRLPSRMKTIGDISDIYKTYKESTNSGVVKANINKVQDTLLTWIKTRSLSDRHFNRASDLKTLIETWFFCSLSDCYWIKPQNSQVQWDEVNLHENGYMSNKEEIFTGNMIESAPTPNGSLCGNLKKIWCIDDDGSRVLYKYGTGEYAQEAINEVVATMIAKHLNIPKKDYVEYKLDIVEVNGERKALSKCKCFTDCNKELLTCCDILDSLPASSYKTDDGYMTEYQAYTKWLKEETDIKQPIKKLEEMLLLDFIIGNTDRHFNNFGVIRDVNTLKIIDIAPIFDNGTSLCNHKNPMIYDYKAFQDYEIGTFEYNEIDQLNLIGDDLGIELPSGDSLYKEIEDYLVGLNYLPEIKIRQIVDFIRYRYEICLGSIDPYNPEEYNNSSTDILNAVSF